MREEDDKDDGAPGYSDRLDADEQVTAEEGIAARIRDYYEERLEHHDAYEPGDTPLSDDDCAELGRRILRDVLARFRPDLFDGGEAGEQTDAVTEAAAEAEAASTIRRYVEHLTGKHGLDLEDEVPLGDEDYAELGRRVVRDFLRRFRPHPADPVGILREFVRDVEAAYGANSEGEYTAGEDVDPAQTARALEGDGEDDEEAWPDLAATYLKARRYIDALDAGRG